MTVINNVKQFYFHTNDNDQQGRKHLIFSPITTSFALITVDIVTNRRAISNVVVHKI